MKNRKISIEKKLLFWLCVCSLAVMLLLTVVINAVLHANEEKHIVQYMTEQIDYFDTAVRQKLYFEEQSASAENFEKVAEEISEEYMSLFGTQVNCYSVYGDLLYSTYEDDTVRRDKSDLNYAMEGQNSFTVAETREETVVYGSLRVTVDGEFIGIMRIRCDYTEDYAAIGRTRVQLLLIAAAILLLATVILAIFMHRFTSPIRRLSEEITANTENPEKMRELPIRTRDEVGELTEAYNCMAETIRMQMRQLEKEKENIRRTMEYQKSFYDNLTHELKTPVTIILGYAEMMEQTELKDREFAEKGVREIITEGKRLREMVSGLLTESRSMSEQHAHEPVALEEMLREVCGAMEMKAQKYGTGISATLIPAVVTGESQRLRQLFVNLLDNAVKYCVGGDPVEVEMTEQGESVTVSVRNKAQADALGDHSRIFMPFYRARRITDRESGSVGLGLSICMNIAQEHGAILSAGQKQDIVCFSVTFEKTEKEGTG